MKEISLKECENELNKLNQQIKNVISKLGNDGENIRIDRDNLDQEFFYNQYRLILDKLIDISEKIKYLSSPIKEQGILRKNKDGRYALPSGEYFTSGSTIEILYTDEDNEQYWLLTRIEHNGEDYYATALGRDISINGMMARTR